MNGEEFVEKLPTVTACQWDGTPEARDWIVGAYNGAAKASDDQITVEGAVHTYTLEPGRWVVAGTGREPMEMSDGDFRARYEAKAG